MGVLLGSMFESGIDVALPAGGQGRTGAYSATEQRNSFLVSLLVLSSAVIRADGKFNTNINPIKVLKHVRRAVSLFKYGLDYISQCLMNRTDRYRIKVFKFLSYT